MQQFNLKIIFQILYHVSCYFKHEKCWLCHASIQCLSWHTLLSLFNINYFHSVQFILVMLPHILLLCYLKWTSVQIQEFKRKFNSELCTTLFYGRHRFPEHKLVNEFGFCKFTSYLSSNDMVVQQTTYWMRANTRAFKWWNLSVFTNRDNECDLQNLGVSFSQVWT